MLGFLDRKCVEFSDLFCNKSHVDSVAFSENDLEDMEAIYDKLLFELRLFRKFATTKNRWVIYHDIYFHPDVLAVSASRSKALIRV